MYSNKKFKLYAKYRPSGDQPSAISSLTKGLKNGLRHQVLLGVTGSGKTYTIANVIQNIQNPALILVHNKTLAAQLYSEMKNLFPDNAVEYFVSYYDYYQPEAYIAASDTYIKKDSSINENINQMRLSTTRAILGRDDVIIISTVSAIYGLGDPGEYKQMLLHLNIGDKTDRYKILKNLSEMQYTRNDVSLLRSTYRVRGEVIDIFPSDSDKDAIRIELFDDRIKDIKIIDPYTSKILTSVSEIRIFPGNHYVSSKDRRRFMVKEIKKELYSRINYFQKKNRLIEAQRISERTLYDIEMISELGYCTGIENYSRFLSRRLVGDPPPTLLDYLPKNTITVIDESHVTIPQLSGMYKGDYSRKKNLVEYGFRLPSALDNRPLKFDEFEALVGQVIYVSATPALYEIQKQQNIVEQIVRPTGLLDPVVEVRDTKIQVEDSLSEIRKATKNSGRTLIVTLTKIMAENLADYLSEHDIKVCYLHSEIEVVERIEIIHSLRKGIFEALVGVNLLREGLDIPEVSTVLVFDADKEGFLRAERSLIQTIGRAARHVNGKAILYASSITKSIQSAVSETQRRRRKQKKFNIENNITPTTIKKSFEETTNFLTILPKKSTNNRLSRKNQRAAPPFLSSDSIISNKEALILVKQLKKLMKTHTRNLEFEKAIEIRDQIKIVKERFTI